MQRKKTFCSKLLHGNKTGNEDLKINDYTFFFLFSITKTRKIFKSTEAEIAWERWIKTIDKIYKALHI